jgi:AAA domain-containing protein
MSVPVLLITGPVGVGKTTVAFEASDLLEAIGVAHAVIDVDALSWCYPTPADDPFNNRLALRNLTCVWANFAAAGAARLILARVVETRDELEAFRQAVPGAELTVVRLRASDDTLRRRVGGREVGSNRESALRRAVELAKLMDYQAVEDRLVDTDGRSVTDIATEVLRRANWPTATQTRA